MLMKPSSRRVRGFTLTEIVIVLGVVSLLLGVIWATASTVMENHGVDHVNQQIIEVVQNIRDQYANTQNPPGWAAPNNITANLDAVKIFPAEMRRTPSAGYGNSLIDHALYDTSDQSSNNAGSFRIMVPSSTAQTAPGPAPSPACNGSFACFRVMLRGLRSSSCIKLLEALPLNDPAMGIVEVGVYNYSTLGSQVCTVTPGTPCITASVSPTTAAGWCSGSTESADDNTYILFVDFKLHN